MISSSSKVIIRLNGGLGNQMFQYAFGRAIARGRDLSFDDSTFTSDGKREFRLDCFDLDITFAAAPLPARLLACAPGAWRLMRLLGGSLRLPGGRLFWDRMDGFDSSAGRGSGPAVAVGYWQDERYFSEIEGEIRERFRPTAKPVRETIALLGEAPQAVGIQVRRGDYLDERIARVHPPQPISYYQEAVRRVVEKRGVRTAIVCSDDPDWVRSNLELPVQRILIREERAEDWEDMHLLSHCAHVVISNSSFGWWSAWLGGPDRMVIHPDPWYGSGGHTFRSPAPERWLSVRTESKRA